MHPAPIYTPLPRPPNSQFVIPLMLVFIVARSVGNRVNEGLYDTQISLKKMPFLEQVRAQEGAVVLDHAWFSPWAAA